VVRRLADAAVNSYVKAGWVDCSSSNLNLLLYVESLVPFHAISSAFLPTYTYFVLGKSQISSQNGDFFELALSDQ
jgi:hypothetical protein